MGSPTNTELKVFFGTIIICFFAIYTWIMLQLGRPFDWVNKKIDPHKAYKEMKTGDMVFVSYNSLRGKLVKIFTLSSWTHSGIILVENGEKYVVEISYYGEDRYGILRTPLREWFEHNDNRVLGWRKYTGKKFPKKKFLSMLERDEARDVEPDTNVVSWLRTLKKWPHDDKNYKSRGQYFCSEYVCHALQEIDVMQGYNEPEGFLPSGIKPWELFYGENLPFKDTHSYSESYMVMP